MVTITIDAANKKANVVVNDAEAVLCPLVKETSGKYSVNIKKLGFGKSFVNIGELEDGKIVEIDEVTLTAGRTAGKRAAKGPQSIGTVGAKFLDEDELATYVAIVSKINAGFQAEYDEEQAAKAAAKKAPAQPLTEKEKLMRKLAKLNARLAELDADVPADEEIVED